MAQSLARLWTHLIFSTKHRFPFFERQDLTRRTRISRSSFAKSRLRNIDRRGCDVPGRVSLLVDFHGAIRPATMTRTWPNLVNVEGVRGLEQNKWSKYANPEHNVTLPFTRMPAGADGLPARRNDKRRTGRQLRIARRRGHEWYIGAMTDWTSRTLEIDFSFLPSGRFQMVAYEDGPNAEKMGHDYKVVTRNIDRTSKLTINLASGGGWAARIYKKV